MTQNILTTATHNEPTKSTVQSNEEYSTQSPSETDLLHQKQTEDTDTSKILGFNSNASIKEDNKQTTMAGTGNVAMPFPLISFPGAFQSTSPSAANSFYNNFTTQQQILNEQIQPNFQQQQMLGCGADLNISNTLGASVFNNPLQIQHQALSQFDTSSNHSQPSNDINNNLFYAPHFQQLDFSQQQQQFQSINNGFSDSTASSDPSVLMPFPLNNTLQTPSPAMVAELNKQQNAMAAAMALAASATNLSSSNNTTSTISNNNINNFNNLISNQEPTKPFTSNTINQQYENIQDEYLRPSQLSMEELKRELLVRNLPYSQTDKIQNIGKLIGYLTDLKFGESDFSSDSGDSYLDSNTTNGDIHVLNNNNTQTNNFYNPNPSLSYSQAQATQSLDDNNSRNKVPTSNLEKTSTFSLSFAFLEVLLAAHGQKKQPLLDQLNNQQLSSEDQNSNRIDISELVESNLIKIRVQNNSSEPSGLIEQLNSVNIKCSRYYCFTRGNVWGGQEYYENGQLQKQEAYSSENQPPMFQKRLCQIENANVDYSLFDKFNTVAAYTPSEISQMFGTDEEMICSGCNRNQQTCNQVHGMFRGYFDSKDLFDRHMSVMQ